VHLDATEHGDALVFLHAVKDGPANRSYGLSVAALAGVPRAVIARAREYLSVLESTRDGGAQHQPPPASNGQAELPLFAPRALSTVEARLSQVNADELTPREALELVYELARLHLAERSAS
jgi:DNA mismatch repair protein MutS